MVNFVKNFAILIPAAGSSSRMNGRDKLLEDVNGDPLLRRIVKRAAATGKEVIVTLPENSPRRAALSNLDVTVLVVKDSPDGMSASFRAAMSNLASNIEALMVVLPDMPEITGLDMALLLSAYATIPDESIIRASTSKGEAGHPVLLPRWTFENLANLEGDTGPRDMLKKNQNRIVLVPLEGDRALLDLDTPEDWVNWRKRTKTKIQRN